jgi:hypothetical protein
MHEAELQHSSTSYWCFKIAIVIALLISPMFKNRIIMTVARDPIIRKEVVVIKNRPLIVSFSSVFDFLMGASPFASFLRKSKRLMLPEDIGVKTYVPIDTSRNIHNVLAKHPDLAAKVYWVDPHSNDAMQLAKQFTKELLNQVPSVLNLSNCHREWLFEDSSAKSDARKERKVQAVSESLNDAVRDVLHFGMSDNHTAKFAGNMGRPPWWFTMLVMNYLREQGEWVCFSREVEADILMGFRCAEMKAAGYQTLAWANDYDLTALVCPQSVDATFVDGQIVVRNEVLLNLDCTPEDVLWAYCLSECDNVTRHIKFVGAAVAWDIVTNMTEFSFEAFVSSFRNVAPRKILNTSNARLKEVYVEIEGIKDEFYWTCGE